MTSVGVYGIYPFGPMSQTDKDKLRERRNKAVERIKILGFTQLVLAIMAITVGIATLIVASREPMAFPVFNPGPLVAGTIMIILAGLKMLTWRTGDGCQDDDETPSGLKCLMMTCYILGLIWMMPCIICAALCIISLVRCTAMPTHASAIYCYPDITVNITLAAIGIVICVVLAITCILNCVFFCVYARAFGFKSRGEKAMMMMMQQNQPSLVYYESQQVQRQNGYYKSHQEY